MRPVLGPLVPAPIAPPRRAQALAKAEPVEL